MSENTKLWDILGRTDPKHTKGFKRSGGFTGTAIKPIWSYLRMTEEFGPCGIGWGVGEPHFQVVPGHDGETLVYCTAHVWFKSGDETSQSIYGVGGDKVVGKNKYGLTSDDEAFKKAFTDAVTNALKLIGVGADVHMGLFDDSKYIDTMKEEFSEGEPPKRQTGYRDDGTRTSYALKKEQPDLMETLVRELNECKTLVSFEKLKAAWRKKATEEKWNKPFTDSLKEKLDHREGEIRRDMERLSESSSEQLADLPTREAIEHSLKMHPVNAG